MVQTLSRKRNLIQLLVLDEKKTNVVFEQLQDFLTWCYPCSSWMPLEFMWVSFSMVEGSSRPTGFRTVQSLISRFFAISLIESTIRPNFRFGGSENTVFLGNFVNNAIYDFFGNILAESFDNFCLNNIINSFENSFVILSVMHSLECL